MAENFYEMYLEEMEQIRPLDHEEERAVLASAARGEKEARNRLVEGYLAAALGFAREYEGRGLPVSDLVQEANMALMMAAAEYDGSRNWREGLEERIRQGIEADLEDQRAEAEVEENMAARVNVLQTVSQVMAKELGREATVDELAEKMKMTPDEIKEIMKLALDALTVNGAGAAASDGGEEDEAEPSFIPRRDGYGRSGRRPAGYDPMRDGWDLNS